MLAELSLLEWGVLGVEVATKVVGFGLGSFLKSYYKLLAHDLLKLNPVHLLQGK